MATGLILPCLGVVGLIAGIVWIARIVSAGDKTWLWAAVLLILASLVAVAAGLPMVDVITKVSSGQADD